MAKKKLNDSPFQPTMLAFTRSLETSEAIMFGYDREAAREMPIEVVETGQRGQSSQEKLNDEDPDKSNAGSSNPQIVEIARMPVGTDTLVIRFTLRVMPNSTCPSATDSGASHAAYREFTRDYAQAEGYQVLAVRYLENIANGRFAWRNRSLSDDARVYVTFGGKKVVFDPYKLKVGEILGQAAIEEAVVEGSIADVEALIEHIHVGLSREPRNIEVEWRGAVAENAEVYPSQEYKFAADAKSSSSKKYDGTPARFLASVKAWEGGTRIRQAAMHSQKIGAAIRAIDDWHGDAFYGAIPVNPYGGIQEAGVALRHRNDNAPSFYDLARDPESIKLPEPGSAPTANMHFFVANLIRGGVFGRSSDKE
jgi:CRISPR-associated protein Csy3